MSTFYVNVPIASLPLGTYHLSLNIRDGAVADVYINGERVDQ